MKDRHKIRTTFLLQELRESKSIYNYIQANHELFSDGVFSEYLTNLVLKNKISRTELVKQLGFSKSYGYAILNGVRKPPSRNRVILLGFGVEATFEEMQNLLVYGEFTPLSPRVQRDAAIIFAIEQKLTSVQLADLLFDLELEGLD